MSRGGDRRPPKVDNMFSLKVDNLAYRTTSEKLRRVFGKYGEIGDVYIPKDPYTHDSRGFAFVRYYDDRDADDAIRKMDGRQIDGREIRVQMARFGRPSGKSSSRRYSRSPRRHRSRSYSRSPDSYREHSRDRYDSRRSRSRSDDY